MLKRKSNIIFVLLLVFLLAGCNSQNDLNKEVEKNVISAQKADYEEDIYSIFNLTLDMMSSFKIENDTAYMNGIINKDTIRQIKELISNYPDVKTIVMQNVEGSIDDESNLIASRLVRKAGLNTHVPADGMIASGGTDFFCAGVKRTVEDGAEIGVHSWGGAGIEKASSLSKEDESHKPYIKYYEEMKLPDPQGFYFFTIYAAEPEDIHNMTRDELIKYGLISEDIN
ncbi:MAG: hypothetical protein N4A64_08010 [Marinisporobacter sp.]|jgi:hypothetical protein|nr:hypothetical protein [Marinisporobacter sp.]